MQNLKGFLKKANTFIGGIFRNYGLLLIAIIILGILIYGACVSNGRMNQAIHVSMHSAALICVVVFMLFLLLAALNTWYKKDLSKRDSSVKEFVVNTFRQFSLWVIPLLGIMGYVLYYGDFLEGKTADIVCKVSDVLVIGGIVGFLTNSFQAFGIFKKELEKVVHSNEFLAERKNISKIWREVSAIMFERKFRTISEDLFTIIEGQYICKDEYSYYDNYRIITEVSWADEAKKFVIVKDTIHFDLITEKRGKVDLSFSAWFSGIKDLKKDEDYYHKFSCWIDDKQAIIRSEDNRNDENDENIYINRCVVTVDNSQSQDKYDVAIKRERKYLFAEDFDISFRARYIVKDLSISLFLPKDLKARFICRGTPKDFKNVKNELQYKEYSYKGLILQRQGYTFALHKM